MKSAALIALLSPAVLAHYTFPNTIVNGVTSAEWQYVRRTTNRYSQGPVENVSDSQIRCYEEAGRPAAQTLTVAAGSTVTFKSSNTMGHPGPVLYYMAKAPSGVDVANWAGDGDVWFKIAQTGALSDPNSYKFQTEMTTISVKVPSSVPSGDYLLRAEHIGLHINGKPQFYIACAQIRVTGGGNGSPSPKVAFPGAYKASDAGLALNIYAGSGGKSYPYPGPAVWQG